MAGSTVSILPPAAIGERDTVIAARRRETGIKPERKFEFGKAIIKAARVEIHAGQPEMGPGILAVGANGRQRGARRNGNRCCQ